MAKAHLGNILRSVQGTMFGLKVTLFNLEGTEKCTLKSKNPWIWGVSSAGRAPALQAGGHRFDPGTLHQKKCRYGPIAQLARAHD